MKKKYLATTGLSQIWDQNSEIVFLAPWCRGDHDNPVMETEVSYYTNDRIKNGKYCEGVYFELLEELTIALNRLHGVNKSCNYWSIILNPWLIYLINMMHERYSRMKNILIHADNSIYTHVVDMDEYTVAVDTFDFMANKVSDDYYNLQLISQIALFLGIDSKKIYFKKGKRPKALRSKNLLLDVLKTRLKKIIINIESIFWRYGEVAMADMYHLNFWDHFLLSSKFKSITTMDTFFPVWKRKDYKYNKELRLKLKLDTKDTEPFVKLLKVTIPYAMPRCYIEGYPDISRYANSIKRPIPKVIISAIGWHFNECFKFYAAEMKERGIKLYGMQHGGDYGFSIYQSCDFFEVENKDGFFSWGWNNSHSQKNIKALPDPYLLKLKHKGAKTKQKKEDFALFVPTNYSRYPYGFTNNPGPEGMQIYFKQQLSFFEHLSSNLKKKLYYRPYPEDHGWDIKEKIRSLVPTIKWADTNRCTDWLQRARLVVIDHPVTSFIEALVMNVPLILYWDFKLWPIKANAKEYFDMLKDVGILYEDAKSAALVTSNIYDIASEWWQHENIQDARTRFIERYGYTKEDWHKIWAREIGHIIYG